MGSDPFGDRMRAEATAAETAERRAVAVYVGAGDTPLEREVRAHVLDGWRVESQTAGEAIVRKGERPNHILHLLLTLITFGLWAIVWIIVALTGGVKRRLITPNGVGGTDVRRV